MIPFLAGAILGAATAWGLATLRASARDLFLDSDEVDRRVREYGGNVVGLTPREQIGLRNLLRGAGSPPPARIASDYDDEPLGV